jgi:hypothetical protein
LLSGWACVSRIFSLAGSATSAEVALYSARIVSPSLTFGVGLGLFETRAE